MLSNGGRFFDLDEQLGEIWRNPAADCGYVYQCYSARPGQYFEGHRRVFEQELQNKKQTSRQLDLLQTCQTPHGDHLLERKLRNSVQGANSQYRLHFRLFKLLLKVHFGRDLHDEALLKLVILF